MNGFSSKTSIVSTQVDSAGVAVRVNWDNGHSARFHAIWLRDNALDPGTRSPSNGQRLITIGDIPRDIKIISADHDSGGVNIIFDNGGEVFSYPSDWLDGNSYDGCDSVDIGWVGDELELWDSHQAAEQVRASYSDVSTDGAALAKWLGYVRRFGFATMTDCPVSSGALLDVVKLFGYVRETNYGKWFEVRTQVNPTNLAYTGLSLQAHTDNPYRDPVPTLQILYCLENSAEGGANSVVDGFAIARRLLDEDREAFRLLSRYCARFEYRGSGDVCLTTHKPMIELGPDGELVAVRCNNRSAGPLTGVPFDDMPGYYSAYRRFAELVDDPDMAVRFKLKPGECFIVDNTRVLHGRTGYGSASGSRWLQGCYADRDGLLSRLCVLEQADQQKQEAM